jgi:hypothetical protein
LCQQHGQLLASASGTTSSDVTTLVREFLWVETKTISQSLHSIPKRKKRKEKKMSSVLTFGIKKWTGRDRVPPGNACAFF